MDKKGKYKFAIPVTWLMCDLVEVYADSLEKARDYVNTCYKLKGEYVDSSFEINEDVIDEYSENIVAQDMIDIDDIPEKDLPLYVNKKWKTKEGNEYFASKFKRRS